MITTVKITNREAGPLKFVLEPWADEYVVAPGEAVDILITSDTAPELEWELAPDGNIFAVLNPAGASAKVRRAG
jgi:hypothetical protein